MILIQGYYTPTDIERRAELRECLLYNLVNRHIDKVHLIVEDDSAIDIEDNKIVPHYLRRRMTFNDAFNLGSLAKGKTILANADIWFDDTLRFLINYNMFNKFFAISRVEEDHKPDIYGQDAWAYQAPIKINANFHLGQESCDHRLAYLAQTSRYDVRNICHTVKIHHIHRGKRNWLPKVEGQTLKLKRGGL